MVKKKGGREIGTRRGEEGKVHKKLEGIQPEEFICRHETWGDRWKKMTRGEGAMRKREYGNDDSQQRRQIVLFTGTAQKGKGRGEKITFPKAFRHAFRAKTRAEGRRALMGKGKVSQSKLPDGGNPQRRGVLTNTIEKSI